MRKDLDYGLLHAMSAFVHVVDAGSFTAAAAQMGLTKAQISRLISVLENRLQTKLLQRTTRRIALTDPGERYAQQCKSILDAVAQAEGEAAGAAVQPSGRLRVMSMAGFGNRYVVPLVYEYCNAYPLVSLEYSSSQFAPDLLAEGIDVSIYLAQRLPDSALVAVKLGAMFSVLCAAPAYLAQHPPVDHPRELAEHACLRLANPSISPQWELVSGRSTCSVDPHGPLTGNGVEVLRDSTLRGLGITLLPMYSVVDDLRQGTLVQVLPHWRSPEIGIFALLPSRRFVDAKTRAWIELIKTGLSVALARDTAFFDAPATAKQASTGERKVQSNASKTSRKKNP
jgi:DNA-binding transcriptional LysR family regulator